jgi:hypothetical protein
VGEDDTEQQSLTDYSNGESHPPVSESRQQREQAPPDEPAELLTWLQHDTTSTEEATSKLPSLIERVRDETTTAWTARKCITHILEDTTPPIDHPELVTILDNEYLETPLVIKHLLEIYPTDATVLESSIDLDFLESDGLTHSERMEAYRGLSRLPPNPDIYDELRSATKIFDGVVKLDKTYPVGGFFQAYSMRCLKAFFEHPHQAPEKCAKQSITDHPWSALRITAANAKQAAESGLLDHLSNTLDGRSVPDGFHNGRIIDLLCEGYIETESSGGKQDLAKVLEASLQAGIQPIQRETVISSLIGLMKGGVDTNRCGRVLATVLDVSDERPINKALIDDIEPIVRQLEHVSSAQDIEDIGHLLKSLSVYPPPPQLKSLYGSTDEEIDSEAKQLVSELRRQFKQRQPILEPGKVEGFRRLSDEYSLVRRTGAITWEAPTLAPHESSIVKTVAQIAVESAEATPEQNQALLNFLEKGSEASPERPEGENNSLQFVVPSYDTEWFDFAVLGAVLAQIVNPDLRIGLHTPATNGWGTKKDVKEALQQYGVASSDNPTEIVPLLDLVPTARMAGDEVKVETTGTTVSDDPPFVTLTRDIEPLAETPADVILYNFLPGIDAMNAAQLWRWRGGYTDGLAETEASTDEYSDIAAQASLANLVQLEDVDIEDVESEHSGDPVHIEMYSIFTSHHAADRRQHVGPPTDLPSPNLVVEDAGQDGVPTNQEVSTTDERRPDVTGLTRGLSQVDLHSVHTDDEIGELLKKIDDYSKKLNDPDRKRALRGFRYTIGSLPVPVELHDTWVQNQIDEGNKWVPRRIHSRRKGIQALTDDATFDAELIDEAVITIDTLLDRIAESNPLSAELMTVLDDAASRGKKVGILCAKKTYKDMLDVYLKEQATDWVMEDDLRLLDEDTVRELSPGEVDWLITFDPLPPQTAIYYHHLAIEKMIVLGHHDGTLEPRVHGVEHKRRPFLPNGVKQSLPEMEVTSHGRTLERDEIDESLTDNLYQTYLSVAAQSRSDDGRQSGASGTMARYRVEFEEAESSTVLDSHPVIVQSEDHLVSAGEYVLRSLSRINSGDVVVRLESGARKRLWEEFLRKDWEDSEESVQAEEAFMDAVDLWYEAVCEGLDAHSPTDDLGDGILGFAGEIEPNVSVTSEAVADWARSVYRADSPSDLVFQSDLRIGPRNPDGVEAVAEAYGSERMANNWNQVFTRMKAIRATHRQRGRVFWEWLAERACDGEVFDVPGVSTASVTRCIEID